VNRKLVYTKTNQCASTQQHSVNRNSDF